MYVSIRSHNINYALLITIGYMLLLSPIARAEKVAVDSQLITRAQIMSQSHNGECAGEVRPDRVVIVGGISAQGLKPMLVKALLDKQIQVIRQYVNDKNGRLVLLELIRAAQTVDKSSSENTARQPFILVQSLEAEFPVTEDVDVMLERIMQLGLDRFGKQVTVEASSYGRNVMVFYRFSDLRSRLDQLHSICKQRLVEQWCQLDSARKNSASCKATEPMDQRFPTLSASLQSSPIMRVHGGQSQYYLTYPWQSAQLGQVELLGNVPLSLNGPMTIRTPDNQP